jgi:predicted deacylase
MSTLTENSGVAAHVAPVTTRGVQEKLLSPFEDLAARSNHLIRPTQQHPFVPRYLYLGERGGGDAIRLGLFATIHGDEPEGALALGRFLRILEQDPEIGRGFALFIYPLCNPTGIERGTRESRSGKDLNREFWRQSPEPEVRFLESEIYLHAFDGIITLHADNTSTGLYGFVNGAVLSENLLKPALRAGEKFLPRDRRHVIDGFPARNGIIYRSYDGVLRAVPGLERPPFELTLETPQKAPVYLQVEAFAAALKTILIEYRSLISFGQNI